MKRILNKITFQIKSKPFIYFSTNKVYKSAEQALDGLKSGSTILFGGFGLSGIPENSIRALTKMPNLNNLTAVANNPGTDTLGLGLLLHAKKISKMITSYVGENKFFEDLYFNGDITVDLIPMGTLAEKLRAGGSGIPAFYTRTGVGTLVETGGIPTKYKLNSKFKVEQFSQRKETKVFSGKKFLLEEAITGNYSIVKAKKADTAGNLVFNKSARNINPDVAMAGKVCIAEVEEIVEEGQIPPDSVHLPGIFVHRIFQGEKFDHSIEKLITQNSNYEIKNIYYDEKHRLLREKIARRACKDLKSGMYVNLGIGIPTLMPTFSPADIIFECENGILGVGPYPSEQNIDSDLINPSKETITLQPGASTFSSSFSFAIIRGGHMDMSIIGAMQVTPTGDIANWIVPHKMVKGMAGAMDIVSSGRKLIVAMQHCSKEGAHKIINKCTYPLTGAGVVNQIITERAVFNVTSDGLLLTDIAKGFTLEDIRQATGSKFKVAHQLASFE